jgi:hypothetical protein
MTNASKKSSILGVSMKLVSKQYPKNYLFDIGMVICFEHVLILATYIRKLIWDIEFFQSHRLQTIKTKLYFVFRWILVQNGSICTRLACGEYVGEVCMLKKHVFLVNKCFENVTLICKLYKHKLLTYTIWHVYCSLVFFMLTTKTAFRLH